MANHVEAETHRNKFEQNVFLQETAKKTLLSFKNLFLMRF